MSLSVLLACSAYGLILLIIGLLTYRRSKNTSDFVMGDRSLNFYVTALSAHASDMSNWLFMAYPAMIFLSGGQAIWTGLGLLIGMWANWQFVAPRLRTETARTNSVTVSGYFSARFGDSSGLLRLTGALLSLLFFAVYVSAGLTGMGLLFETLFDIPPVVGMTVGIGLVLAYTLIGGYYSVCWIDLFQALFLLGVIIVVPLLALTHIGGLPTIAAAWSSHDFSLSPFAGDRPFMQFILASAFGWGLGYFGQIHILSKFMGIRNPNHLKRSKWVGLIWQALCLAAATLVGIVAFAFFEGTLDNPELSFILLVKQLFSPFVGSFVLCAILAATLSTIDAQLLVLVSVLSDDLYVRFFRRNASDGETLWVSRLFLVLVCGFAFVVAATSGQSVCQLVFFSWSGLGSAFGPLLLLALYSKRVNRYGAFTGLLFGGTIAAVWPWIGSLLPLEIPALIPGFVLNLILIYTVSLLTQTQTIEESIS